MQSVNFRTSVPPQVQAVKPAVSVWKDRLEVSRSDVLAKLAQKAGLIGAEQICDAQEIAESLNKSVDQVLATSFLNEKQSELCAAAMNYIERGVVTEALAADGLMVANSKGVSFVEGLKYFGFGW